MNGEEAVQASNLDSQMKNLVTKHNSAEARLNEVEKTLQDRVDECLKLREAKLLAEQLLKNAEYSGAKDVATLTSKLSLEKSWKQQYVYKLKVMANEVAALK